MPTIERSKFTVFVLLLAVTLLGSFLRINKFDASPPALFVDEADIGYQASSLKETGKDYFGNPLPVHLQSFADQRTPLYIYTAIPTVLLFGLNSFSVRLPALIFGILTIPAFFWLARNIAQEGSFSAHKNLLGLFAAGTLAVLPWHIHYSRMAFEVTLLLLLLSLGLTFFIRWLTSNKFSNLTFSIIFLALSPYVYSTAKLLTPLLSISLIFLGRKYFARLKKIQIIFLILLATVLVFPLGKDILFGPGRDRFSILSVFGDTNSIGNFQHLQWLSGYAGTYFPFNFIHPQTLAKVFLNQPVNLIYQILNSYLTSFSPQFLMFNGDPNLRHNLPISGVAGITLTALFYIGIVATIVSKSSIFKSILVILLILSPISAAITREGQYHATRLFPLILPFIIAASLGLLFLVQKFAKSKVLFLFIPLLAGMLIWEVSRDQFLRLTAYPNVSYNSWNFGWEENVKRSIILAPQYDEVLIDNLEGAPVQTFFAFYQKISPAEFQGFAKNPDSKSESLKIPTRKYFQGNISFADVDPAKLDEPLPKKVLALVPLSKVSEKEFRNIETVGIVTNPWGDPLYYFITNKIQLPGN